MEGFAVDRESFWCVISLESKGENSKGNTR